MGANDDTISRRTSLKPDQIRLVDPATVDHRDVRRTLTRHLHHVHRGEGLAERAGRKELAPNRQGLPPVLQRRWVVRLNRSQPEDNQRAGGLLPSGRLGRRDVLARQHGVREGVESGDVPRHRGVLHAQRGLVPVPEEQSIAGGGDPVSPIRRHVDAQRRFNPEKGSIPLRTDVPEDAFGPFLQGQMNDCKNSEVQPPSTAHRLAVPPDVLTNLGEAMATFIPSWNVERTYRAVEQAFQ